MSAKSEAIYKQFSEIGIIPVVVLNDAKDAEPLGKALMEGGLPFEVRQPRYNAETEAAIEETRKIMDGSIPAKRYTSVDDMFNDALAEDTVHA